MTEEQKAIWQSGDDAQKAKLLYEVATAEFKKLLENGKPYDVKKHYAAVWATQIGGMMCAYGKEPRKPDHLVRITGTTCYELRMDLEEALEALGFDVETEATW